MVYCYSPPGILKGLCGKLSRTGKNCVKTNLRHALLLLLGEGADDMWWLGEDVLRNLSHNIRHRVEVADHLDQCFSISIMCYCAVVICSNCCHNNRCCGTVSCVSWVGFACILAKGREPNVNVVTPSEFQFHSHIKEWGKE